MQLPMFAHPDFDGHEHVTFCHDANSGLKAIIAIHSLVLGPALGGCRLQNYNTIDGALKDALRLSRAMSFKNALGERPFGGGKAIIFKSPEEKNDSMLEAFGRAVDLLGGHYITAEDAGIDPQDIARIARTTKHVRNIAQDRGGPAPYTAYGIFVAIETALSEVLGKEVKHATVAIQGLGGVGMDLCERLRRAGAEVIVSDVVDERCRTAQVNLDCRVATPEDVHKGEADVFAPCAFGGVLNQTSIEEIRAPIIAGAANNQLATDADGARLARRGIVYCPDYVINAGGIRATASPQEPFNHQAALRRVEGIGPLLKRIIAQANETQRPTNMIADEMAREKLQNCRRQI